MTPLWLAPRRGRGRVCFNDVTSYAGWKFLNPNRAAIQDVLCFIPDIHKE